MFISIRIVKGIRQFSRLYGFKGLLPVPEEPEVIRYAVETNTNSLHSLGALPYVELHDYTVQRELMEGASETQLETAARLDAQRLEAMDCHICVDARSNLAELATVPTDRANLYSRVYKAPL